MIDSIKRHLSIPVVASILQNRKFAVVIIVAACIQTGLAVLGLNGWPCPIQSVLGIPCPGCGLSTGLAFLIRGDWAGVLHEHIFAPFVLAGFVIMAGVCALPGKHYTAATRVIEKCERASGLVPIILTAMIIYWGVRLSKLL